MDKFEIGGEKLLAASAAEIIIVFGSQDGSALVLALAYICSGMLLPNLATIYEQRSLGYASVRKEGERKRTIMFGRHHTGVRTLRRTDTGASRGYDGAGP